MDHERHLSSCDEYLAVSSIKKSHPLSALTGFNIGEIQGFEEYLQEKHQGDIEQFWRMLLDRDSTHSRRFVIFADQEMYFRLQLQYWKSIFAKPDGKLLYELYELYRRDHDLKRLTHCDRGDNFLGTHRDLYPAMSFEAFSERAESIGESITLRSASKAQFSVEYLIANYLADPSTPLTAALKQKILKLAWSNWFNDVEELKCEILAGAVNLDQLYPEITREELERQGVDEVLGSHPSLRWVFDERLSAGNEGHVLARYSVEHFPEIQRKIDRICKIRVRVKGIEEDSVDTFNQASDTRRLFSGDFQGILQEDIERCFGSFFLKGRGYMDFNHYFVGLLYRAAKQRDTAALLRFKLS